MRQCKSVKQCIELAITDAYDDAEQATAWLTSVQEILGRFDRVNVLGQEVVLEGFELANGMAIVAICRQGERKARVTIDTVAFPDLKPIEALWLKAWKQFSETYR